MEVHHWLNLVGAGALLSIDGGYLVLGFMFLDFLAKFLDNRFGF